MFSGKSVMLEGFNEELKEAEAMVKEISEEQVSLLMLKAMAGYPIFLKEEEGEFSFGKEGMNL